MKSASKSSLLFTTGVVVAAAWQAAAAASAAAVLVSIMYDSAQLQPVLSSEFVVNGATESADNVLDTPAVL